MLVPYTVTEHVAKCYQVLSDMSKSKKLVPTSIEFVDIAGLVKGASTGEGLGNKFLANIRECDSIVQVWHAQAPCSHNTPAKKP